MKKLQLLSEIKDFTNVKTIIESDDWIVEQKIDGQRVALHCNRGEARMFNRKGNELTVPKPIAKSLSNFPDRSFILDGEYLNGTYYAFDALSIGGKDIDFKILKHRKFLMRPMVKTLKIPEIKSVDWATTAKDKALLIRQLKDMRAEGIVAKNLQSIYSYGNRTEDMLKYKFYKTADCIVGETWVNGKQAVQLLVLDKNNNFIDIGKCKVVPSMLKKLSFGDIIEVKYLYATSSNRLYQPIFSKKRNDKTKEECRLDQLIGTCKEILVK